MSEIVNRLEDHVASARMKTTPVIDFEKNESLKGLDYLDTIYHAIVNEHPLQLKYRSFKARSANSFIFYPYLLKEYRTVGSYLESEKADDIAESGSGQNPFVRGVIAGTLYKEYILRPEHIL